MDINEERLNLLKFADDIVLIPDNAESMNEMLQDLSRTSARVGLTSDYSKSELMTNSSREKIGLGGA